jgi:hypothetical protein
LCIIIIQISICLRYCNLVKYRYLLLSLVKVLRFGLVVLCIFLYFVGENFTVTKVSFSSYVQVEATYGSICDTVLA